MVNWENIKNWISENENLKDVNIESLLAFLKTKDISKANSPENYLKGIAIREADRFANKGGGFTSNTEDLGKEQDELKRAIDLYEYKIRENKIDVDDCSFLYVYPYCYNDQKRLFRKIIDRGSAFACLVSFEIEAISFFYQDLPDVEVAIEKFLDNLQMFHKRPLIVAFFEGLFGEYGFYKELCQRSANRIERTKKEINESGLKLARYQLKMQGLI